MPSIKTTRFLGFTEALLQVEHRYGEGIDADIRTDSSPGRLCEWAHVGSISGLVFMKPPHHRIRMDVAHKPANQA